eukprot:5734193-Pleurochrysis_carterae.AAC.1
MPCLISAAKQPALESCGVLLCVVGLPYQVSMLAGTSGSASFCWGGEWGAAHNASLFNTKVRQRAFLRRQTSPSYRQRISKAFYAVQRQRVPALDAAILKSRGQKR